MQNLGDSGDGGLVSNRKIDTELIGSSLQWKRAGKGWRLFDGRRRFGDVLPDREHPGMWRCVLSSGRLSDMANLSWARNAVMDAAVRELQFEARQRAATDPSKCPVNGGVFGDGAAPVRQTEKSDPDTTDGWIEWPPEGDAS
jgi:hypothetical protein